MAGFCLLLALKAIPRIGTATATKAHQLVAQIADDEVPVGRTIDDNHRRATFQRSLVDFKTSPHFSQAHFANISH